jgi:DNA-binding Xre family transcriptional regulator
MKIELQVKEVAAKRGIKTAYKLQIVVGLSPSNAAKLFANRSSMISLATLGVLCEKLACTPDDLFRFRGRKA